MTTLRRRAERVCFAVAVLLGVLAVVAPSGTAPAGAAGGLTRTVTAQRTFVDADGRTTVASTNKITLHVSQADNLRGRQEIKVRLGGRDPDRRGRRRPELLRGPQPGVPLRAAAVPRRGRRQGARGPDPAQPGDVLDADLARALPRRRLDDPGLALRRLCQRP
ncbi:hypothetical protein G5V59_06195 [Nocardioides sp. W3-2-3]|uniref:hypothetical protein n=1 Tax=Nocardioides convexus TaxID=2712224 RepID=UPI00241828F0|nr:hypothetical protein [Nocardioides convexus]NGZ99968.1 hypothetical protein [Nocardioides convexus]